MQEATTDAYIPKNHSVMCCAYPSNGLKRRQGNFPWSRSNLGELLPWSAPGDVHTSAFLF